MDVAQASRIQRLRDAGYKITGARQAVLHALENAEGHLTSAQIVEAVASADPSIGRASVFRTLDLLTRMSLIRPTFVDSSAPVFVLLPGGHHHHIVCTQCNAMIEFDDCGLDSLAGQLERDYGVAIMGHLLEFYGLCSTCRAKV